MKKLIPLLVLLLAGQAWGQTYDMMGDSGAANSNSFVAANDDVCWMATQNGGTGDHVYDASAGDTVTMFKAWVSDGDSISFGIYEFDRIGDTPTVRVYVDTAVFSTGSAWDSLAANFGLTAGKSYCVAMAAIGTTHNLKGLASGSDTLENQVTPTEWPAAWSSSNDAEDQNNTYNLFARVAQYGAGAGAIIIGPTVIGPTVIGP